jgi:serine/threonine protein kinase
VHFADTDSCGAVQQASLAPAHSSALTAGSSGGRLAQAPDSYSSSADGKCVATDLKRVKSSHSQKEPSRRYEHWLVLEFCDQGSLSHFLQQWPPPGDEGDGDATGSSMLRVLHLLADAAQGLEELHKKHYVHGDLVSDVP